MRLSGREEDIFVSSSPPSGSGLSSAARRRVQLLEERAADCNCGMVVNAVAWTDRPITLRSVGIDDFIAVRFNCGNGEVHGWKARLICKVAVFLLLLSYDN
mmetsp:Transcript_4318/g.9286  ORF Transcript_4318/g.9286 Transcript_4318/m.9286 type:complete len:101 (+) Transcript_4318:232-534(+)